MPTSAPAPGCLKDAAQARSDGVRRRSQAADKGQNRLVQHEQNWQPQCPQPVHLPDNLALQEPGEEIQPARDLRDRSAVQEEAAGESNRAFELRLDRPRRGESPGPDRPLQGKEPDRSLRAEPGGRSGERGLECGAGAVPHRPAIGPGGGLKILDECPHSLADHALPRRAARELRPKREHRTVLGHESDRLVGIEKR